MTLWTILLITYTSGPFAGSQSSLPFRSAQACGDAILELASILPPADYQCEETGAFATSIRPKGRG